MNKNRKIALVAIVFVIFFDFGSIKVWAENGKLLENSDVIKHEKDEISTSVVAKEDVIIPKFEILKRYISQGTKVEIIVPKDSKVFYTIDGTDPTEVGIEYIKGIVLDSEGVTTTIKAVTKKNGSYSDIVETSYTVLEKDITSKIDRIIFLNEEGDKQNFFSKEDKKIKGKIILTVDRSESSNLIVKVSKDKFVHVIKEFGYIRFKEGAESEISFEIELEDLPMGIYEVKIFLVKENDDRKMKKIVDKIQTGFVIE